MVAHTEAGLHGVREGTLASLAACYLRLGVALFLWADAAGGSPAPSPGSAGVAQVPGCYCARNHGLPPKLVQWQRPRGL
jgi:hypothetical protein